MKIADVVELVRRRSGRVTTVEVAHHFRRLRSANGYRSVRQMVSNAVALGHIRYGDECKRDLSHLARDYAGRPELVFVSSHVTIEKRRRDELAAQWPGQMSVSQAARHNGIAQVHAKLLKDKLRALQMLCRCGWLNRATGIYEIGDPKNDVPKPVPAPIEPKPPRPPKLVVEGKREARIRKMAAAWPRRMSVAEAAELNAISVLDAGTLRLKMRASKMLRRCGYNEAGQPLYELGDPSADEVGVKPVKQKPVKPKKKKKANRNGNWSSPKKAQPKPKEKPARRKTRDENREERRARERAEGFYASLFPRVNSIFQLGDVMGRTA